MMHSSFDKVLSATSQNSARVDALLQCREHLPTTDHTTLSRIGIKGARLTHPVQFLVSLAMNPNTVVITLNRAINNV